MNTDIVGDKSLSAFFASGGSPRMVTSFCVYVDILGFREILENADAAFEDFMKNIRPVIRWFAGLENDGSMEFENAWKAKVFSDNIFLVHPFKRSIIGSGDGESEFSQVMNRVVYFQYWCFIHKYFLRGGASFGKMFIDNESIFGQPLADLVDLEKAAKYPRIILSKTLFPFLNTYRSFYGSRRPDVFDYFSIDSKNTVFVDYLYQSVHDTEEHIEYEVETEYGSRGVSSRMYNWESLEKHKCVVEEKLKQYVGEPDVHLKYIWSAAYHNYCCQRYSRCEDFNRSLFIEGVFPDFGFRPLMPDDISNFGETRSNIPVYADDYE